MTIVAERFASSSLPCLGTGAPANDGATGRLRRTSIHVCRNSCVEGKLGKGSQHPCTTHTPRDIRQTGGLKLSFRGPGPGPFYYYQRAEP